MHSLNQPVLAQATANELHAALRRPRPIPRRPERPPGPPLRGRAAYVAGRLARRLDSARWPARRRLIHTAVLEGGKVARLRRLAALLAVADVLLAVPAAKAAPLVGIGEQNPSMFSDPRWRALGLQGRARDRRLRRAALRLAARGPGRVHGRRARGGSARLLGFGHSRTAGKEDHLPSVATFTKEFRAFRARYPW
jgi:hypothetical protein